MVTDTAPTTEAPLEISCQSCGATLRVEPHLRSTVCPYCASPSIVSRPRREDRPAPTFIVPFVIDHEHATAAVKRWIAGSHLFARSDFKAAAPELTRGVYLPAYLYGAVADSEYTARIGENYTVTETYTTTDSKGRTVTRTRTVTKTEWRSLQGRHRCYLVDILVTASQGVANAALEAIEPFDLRALRRYRDGYIAGWIAEEPSRTQDECFHLAHDEALAEVGQQLSAFMPGDSHHDLDSRTSLRDEMIDFVLLPVWSYAVRYAEDQPPLQILVNGQTGRVGGKVPLSTTKVVAAIVAGLLLIGLVWLLVSMFG
jgi:predicted RNA-binding Zn-ribbon protein involved in translation (DUF1610 family)